MSALDPVGIFKALAKQFRARVGAINLHDPNVPGRFRHEIKLRIRGRRFSVRANARFVVVETRETESGFVFSINRPDRIVWTTGRLHRNLRSKKLARCIENLGLGRQESLHLYRNGLAVYLTPRSTERIIDVIDRLEPLIDLFPPPTKKSTDYTGLPNRFLPLTPFMRTWAVSDDYERGEKLAGASRARLRRLVSRVSPHFKAINNYLDGFGDQPIPESAASLGTLAECAAEALLLVDD